MLRSQEDIDRSTEACLWPLIQISKDYDAFLLACYADHPLVAALQAHAGDRPVVGIFEASIAVALAALPPSKRFAILTTGKAYEEQLEKGVRRLLGDERRQATFAGVISTGIGLDDLDQQSSLRARTKIREAVQRMPDLKSIGAICIGGVILVGKEDWVRESCEAEIGRELAAQIVIIDQLQAGAEAVARALDQRQCR